MKPMMEHYGKMAMPNGKAGGPPKKPLVPKKPRGFLGAARGG